MTEDKEMEQYIVKMIRVKKYTHDPQILATLNHVATTQEELDELLDGDVSPIYLCGETFQIPEHKQYLQLIPINTPVLQFIDTIHYDEIIVEEPYQASPLHKSFRDEFSSDTSKNFYHLIMADMQGFTFDARKDTHELYLTIMNSDLPILR